eukprot:SM000189S04090  [mRNA]  locus=s189:238133:241307:+ [translate_table: standard]
MLAYGVEELWLGAAIPHPEQVKVLLQGHLYRCPFCKAPGYAVEYRGAQTQEEKGVEQLEEQKVIEAKIRMRQQELDEDKERARTRTDSASSILPMPPVLSDNLATAPTSEAAPHGPPQLMLEASHSASGPAWGLWSSSPNRAGAASATSGGGPHSPHPVARGVEPDSVWSRSGLRASAGEVRNLSGPGIQPSQLLTQSHATAGSHAAAARMQFGPGAPAGGVLSPLTGSHRQRAASVSQPLRAGSRAEGQASVVDDPDSSIGIEGQSQRRSEVFDLDFDDIMLMEAIWQSLREQELQRHVHTEQASSASVRTGAGPARADVPVGSKSLYAEPGRSSVTWGLAEAIAALAERRAVPAAEAADSRPPHLGSSLHAVQGHDLPAFSCAPDAPSAASSSEWGQSNVSSESIAEWMREREMLARSSVDDLVPSNLRRSQSRDDMTGLPGSQQSIGAPLENVERSGASSSSTKESMGMSVEPHGEDASQPRPPAVVAELSASPSLAAESPEDAAADNHPSEVPPSRLAVQEAEPRSEEVDGGCMSPSTILTGLAAPSETFEEQMCRALALSLLEADVLSTAGCSGGAQAPTLSAEELDLA